MLEITKFVLDRNDFIFCGTTYFSNTISLVNALNFVVKYFKYVNKKNDNKKN